MNDLILLVLKMVTGGEAKGINFVNLCNPADEKVISNAFSVDPELPMIIVGLDDEKTLKILSQDNKKLNAILARPRCIYIKLPCESGIIEKVIEKVTQQPKQQVTVALEEITKLEEIRRQVGYIKHLAAYREGNTEIVKRLAEEKLGWTGTGEEIMQRLAEFNPETEIARHFSGSVIPGVFCDVEGTLLDFLGESINEEVVRMLEKYEAEGKAISLWSGGDPKEILPKLKGFKWPFLSKYDFKGCTVEIAIDDLPTWKLKKDYKIRAEKYIHYDPCNIWDGKEEE